MMSEQQLHVVPLPKKLLPTRKSTKLLSLFFWILGNNFLGKGTNMM